MAVSYKVLQQFVLQEEGEEPEIPLEEPAEEPLEKEEKDDLGDELSEEE